MTSVITASSEPVTALVMTFEPAIQTYTTATRKDNMLLKCDEPNMSNGHGYKVYLQVNKASGRLDKATVIFSLLIVSN